MAFIRKFLTSRSAVLLPDYARSIMGDTRIGSTDWVDLRGEREFEVRPGHSCTSTQPRVELQIAFYEARSCYTRRLHSPLANPQTGVVNPESCVSVK